MEDAPGLRSTLFRASGPPHMLLPPPHASSSNSSSTTAGVAGSRPLVGLGAQGQPVGPSHQLSKRRRKHSTVTQNACTECRKKRAKCDGQKPCGRCRTQEDIACVYKIPVRQSKENLRHEIEHLRSRQRSHDQLIAALLRPDLLPGVLSRLRDGHTVESVASSLSTNASTATIVSTPSSVSSSIAIPNAVARGTHHDVPLSVSQQVQALIRQSEDLQKSQEIGQERISFNFLVAKPSSVPGFVSIIGGRNGAGDGWSNLPYTYYVSSSQYQIPRPLPSHPSSSASNRYPEFSARLADGNPSGYITFQGDPYRKPDGVPRVWAATPQNSHPTCLLDSILLGFLHERRKLLAEGQPRSEVVGPKYPSVSSLLNKDEDTTAHPISSIFTAIVRTFPSLSRLPEQVGVVYMMFLVMRWQVEPTHENYEHLPPCFRPLPSQVSVPHPAWMDYLPFPHMRNRMIGAIGKQQAGYELADFFVPYTNTLSVNWPYEDSYVLIQNRDTAAITINPVFDAHVRNLDNWTAGEAFRQRFPELTGTYNFKA